MDSFFCYAIYCIFEFGNFFVSGLYVFEMIGIIASVVEQFDQKGYLLKKVIEFVLGIHYDDLFEDGVFEYLSVCCRHSFAEINDCV